MSRIYLLRPLLSINRFSLARVSLFLTVFTLIWLHYISFSYIYLPIRNVNLVSVTIVHPILLSHFPWRQKYLGRGLEVAGCRRSGI